MRHEPAFFGMFQSLTGDAWGFLADLSDQDHMFATFSEPVQVLLFRLTGINGLPLMMGLIFYLQQKYMTPPATGTQTPEQEQMQKIMRWMLVITFPVFLYGAPSGLTLYIVTSSTIGILESRWIRKKVDTMDLDSEPPPKPAGPRGGGSPGGSGDQSLNSSLSNMTKTNRSLNLFENLFCLVNTDSCIFTILFSCLN